MESIVVDERIDKPIDEFPSVWTLVERFKVICRSKGLKTYEYEDLVDYGGKHHKFIWVRKVHPATFRSVNSSHNCSIREGVSYKTVNVSYLAWLMLEGSLEKIVQMVRDDSGLSERIAIYDLSKVYTGKPVCLKFNKTDSAVFQEFEKFLERKYNIEFKSYDQTNLQEPTEKSSLDTVVESVTVIT